MFCFMMVGVSASNYVDDYFGIQWQHQNQEQENYLNKYQGTCNNIGAHKLDFVKLNSNAIFLEAITTFKDGDHIIHFNEDKIEGVEFITIKKRSGKIASIQPGVCAENSDFKLYKIPFNMERLNTAIESGDRGKLVFEIYDILNNIEGVHFMQKFHVLKTLIIHGVDKIEI